MPFVSEMLQADIRLFVRDDEGIYIYDYYHPNQDSLFVNPNRGTRLQAHKDIPVHKAFESGKLVIGQYGFVINNRSIQEYAYPLIVDGEVFAVLAVERDIYLTRWLRQHWDITAEVFIKSLNEKLLSGKKYPPIAPGEGAMLLRAKEKGAEQTIFVAGPFAVSLLGELVESSEQLVNNRTLQDVFSNYQITYKGSNPSLSIEKIEEVVLKQKTISLRHVALADETSVVLIKDVSEIKLRETLLKEIHHRVKNNLQTVVSLLRMQHRRNPELKDSFAEAINRIKSITIVHEFLSRNGNIEQVDFGHLVASIIKELLISFGFDEKLKLNFNCPDKVFINSEKATNLALVINELLSNSLEHGGEELSEIELDMNYAEDATGESDMLLVSISDNGKGFPKGFDYKSSTGLGWEIVRFLAEESLDAKIVLSSTEANGRGAKIALEIPNVR